MMIVVYSPEHARHSPEFETYDGRRTAYPETPRRIEIIAEVLRQRKLGRFVKPEKFAAKHIYSVHDRRYVDFLRRRSANIPRSETLQPSYFISDTYAPLTNGTYPAARMAAYVALSGAKALLEGELKVYSLCRPPGHHACCQSMGGYCYFNNSAIAANYLSHHGKVAILDIDYHHGNGTQQAFYERSDVLYVSLHADPVTAYPYASGFSTETGLGIGAGFNINYPLPKSTGTREYLKVLRHAMSDIKNFEPDFLVVSCGYDTYRLDPIAGFRLGIPAYRSIGQAIKSAGLPTLIVQEGGYHLGDLSRVTESFVSGLL